MPFPSREGKGGSEVRVGLGGVAAACCAIAKHKG